MSLPCWELFDLQPAAYRDEVLPPRVRKRVSVEAGVSLGWERCVGDEGAIVGIDHFGASAPARRSSSTSASPRSASPTSPGGSSATGCAAASRPSTPATSPPASTCAGPKLGHGGDAEPAR